MGNFFTCSIRPKNKFFDSFKNSLLKLLFKFNVKHSRKRTHIRERESHEMSLIFFTHSGYGTALGKMGVKQKCMTGFLTEVCFITNSGAVEIVVNGRR